MLFAIAGRKKSGKTTASKILLNKGFEPASFAAGLKEYVSKLYNWNISDLYSQEGKEGSLNCPVKWDEEAAKRLGDMVHLHLVCKEERIFRTKRDALQYIGTDVLRDADSDFHLKEFKKRYSDGKFVCDDIRFPNELKMLREMNAIYSF